MCLNEQLDTSLEMLKELETVDSNMLDTIFTYNKLNAREQI